MPPTTLYKTDKACRRCSGPLPAGSSVNRLYCPACGHERRALTQLAEADRQLEASGSNRARVARATLNRAMGELEAPGS